MASTIIALLLSVAACTNALPAPAIDDAPSAKHNRVHEVMKKPMSYILLYPIVSAFLAGIVITIIQLNMRKNKQVNDVIKAGEIARAGMVEKIKIEEKAGKELRMAERVHYKESQMRVR